MQVAIASGKGGTGKTTVAANLAVLLARRGQHVQLLDADVEEPNSHLLLHPEITRRVPVTVQIPELIPGRCTRCGACASVCQYGAIMCPDGFPMIFRELCHSCGGCALVCIERAIEEHPHEVGQLEFGDVNGLSFGLGRLNVGEARAVPVIDALRDHAATDGLVLIDAPPGASCPVMAAVKGCDFVCLVAESTPFGLHDLDLTVALARELKLPIGVIANRVGMGDDRVQDYCRERQIPILGEIPDDCRLAAAHAEGHLALDAVPDLEQPFAVVAEAILQQVSPCES
ncbi:MAG: ATP-binding protein [Phycisphaerae bacterium]|jgi:MinD superfamily P-loop ATPase